MINSINSVNVNPSFGKGEKVVLYIKANANEALNAAKNAFKGDEYVVSTAKIKPSVLNEYSKVVVECKDGWNKSARDILWNNLIKRRVVNESNTKKVVYDGLDTFVSRA